MFALSGGTGMPQRKRGAFSSKQRRVIDQHVGARLRLRRTVLGLSQEKVAKAVGVTFQQLQKYEAGQNRISASRLHAVAKLLDIDIPFVFDGVRVGARVETPPDREGDVRLNRETLELARNYLRIADPRTRKALFDLIAASARRG